MPSPGGGASGHDLRQRDYQKLLWCIYMLCKAPSMNIDQYYVLKELQTNVAFRMQAEAVIVGAWNTTSPHCKL